MTSNSKDLEPCWKVVGVVRHYFSKAGVAVVNFSKTIKKGDTIRIVGGKDTDFEQKVDSLEIDHQKVDSVKKGEEAGLKVKKIVREGYTVYTN